MRIRRAVTNLPVLSSAEAGPGRVTCPARAKAFTLTSGFWLDIVLFLFQHGAPSCLTHVLLNGTTPLVRGHRAPIAADTNATSSSSWNPIRRHTRSASRVSEARPQCVRPTPDPDASGTVYDSTFHTVIWRFFPVPPAPPDCMAATASSRKSRRWSTPCVTVDRHSPDARPRDCDCALAA